MGCSSTSWFGWLATEFESLRTLQWSLLMSLVLFAIADAGLNPWIFFRIVFVALQAFLVLRSFGFGHLIHQVSGSRSHHQNQSYVLGSAVAYHLPSWVWLHVAFFSVYSHFDVWSLVLLTSSSPLP